MYNRRSFIKTIGKGAAGIYLLSAFDSVKKGKKLTILHTNDLHSRIDPFEPGHSKYANRGGLLKIAALVEKIRKQEENVLLLDCGDIFQGTPYFNYFGGEVEFKIMSAMGYEASTMGNHDFDNGLEGFSNALPYAQFPFICSNYDFSNTLLQEKTKQHLIVHKNDIKIGILGLGIELEGLVPKKLYGKTIYLDPIKTANEKATFLKQEKKCDLVICLSHLGNNYKSKKISDQILVTETENIDLILGGHTHTFMDKAETFLNLKGKQTLVSQAGWAGLQLGRIDVTFDQKKDYSTDNEAAIFNIKNYAIF